MISSKDLSASLVGALATLPQVIAYGLIAFSPLGTDWVIYGLTASLGSAILFGLLTASLSTNPSLLSGPRAMTALVIAGSIQAGLNIGLSPELTVLMSFSGIVIAGFFQYLAGILKVGHLASYLPVPVLGGFVTASAFLVIFKSLPIALNLPQENFPSSLFSGEQNIDTWALLVSGITLIIAFSLEVLIRAIPSALIGIITGTAVYYIGLDYFDMPEGQLIQQIETSNWLLVMSIFPAEPDWHLFINNIGIAFSVGVSVSLLAAFDTVLSLIALDKQIGTSSNLNKELKHHGLTNMLMGVVGFLPGSGTMNRSMAVYQSRPNSNRLANIGSSLMLFLLVIVLLPMLGGLPLWAAIGMLIAISFQAIDRSFFEKILSIIGKKIPFRQVLIGDVFVELVVITTALVFSLNAAIGVGIFISVLMFAIGTGRSPVRRIILGSRLYSKIQRPAEELEFLEQHGSKIAVFELQGALFFGSSVELLTETKKIIRQNIQFLIMDLRKLSSVDSSGASTIIAVKKLCSDNNIQLFLSCLEVERRLFQEKLDLQGNHDRRKSKLTPRWIWLNMHANRVFEYIELESIYDDTYSALAHCEELLLKHSGFKAKDSLRRSIDSSNLLNGLNDEEVRRLSRFTEIRKFRADENVFLQDSNGDSAYFLVKGKMDVLLEIPGSSRKRRITTLIAGNLFGEMSLLDHQSRSASVKAATDAMCFKISKDNFDQLRKSHPEIGFKLMKNLNQILSNRLRQASNVIAELEQ